MVGPIGQTDEGDLIAIDIFAIRGEAPPHPWDQLLGCGAVVDEDRNVYGSIARETRRTSRAAPSSRTMKSLGRVQDRLAFLINRTDEHRPFARRLRAERSRGRQT
jgi:hypothetical protein